jgi:hypothetical protein
MHTPAPKSACIPEVMPTSFLLLPFTQSPV